MISPTSASEPSAVQSASASAGGRSDAIEPASHGPRLAVELVSAAAEQRGRRIVAWPDPDGPLRADLAVGAGHLVVCGLERVGISIQHGVHHGPLRRRRHHGREHPVALERPRALGGAARQPVPVEHRVQDPVDHATVAPAARSSSSARSESPSFTSIPRIPPRSIVTRKPSRRASSAVCRTQ